MLFLSIFSQNMSGSTLGEARLSVAIWGVVGHAWGSQTAEDHSMVGISQVHHLYSTNSPPHVHSDSKKRIWECKSSWDRVQLTKTCKVPELVHPLGLFWGRRVHSQKPLKHRSSPAVTGLYTSMVLSSSATTAATPGCGHCQAALGKKEK